jgi:hypothetical protein
VTEKQSWVVRFADCQRLREEAVSGSRTAHDFLNPPSFDDSELEIGASVAGGCSPLARPNPGIRCFGKSQFHGIGNLVCAALLIESASVALRT